MDAAIVSILLLLVVLAGAWFKRQSDRAAEQLRTMRSERDELDRALENATARWDTVANNIRDGIFLIGFDGRIEYLNPVAEGIFGSPIMQGESFEKISRQLQIQPLLYAVLERRAESLSQIVVMNERTFQLSMRARTDGALIVVGEITELERLGRMRRDFVANISHELRTPVATMQLLAETLENELRGDSAAAPWISKLVQQIDLLRQLTDELMDLALIESGQMPIKLVKTPAQDLVNETIEFIRAQAERKQVAVSSTVPAGISVLADPQGARRVLGNLLHNAVKFTPAGGSVEIRARPVDDMVEFQVRDTGIGIPARDLPRIFERFYRVDRARAAGETRGTGLGLAIAKHIVESHGGKIWAESEAGKGSVLQFTLPREEA